MTSAMNKVRPLKKSKKQKAHPSIDEIIEPHALNRRGQPFSETHPEVAKEWYYKLNCGFTGSVPTANTFGKRPLLIAM